MKRITRLKNYGKAGELKHCERCFKTSLHSRMTLSWSPETHWMYDPNLRNIAIYLLWVGKQCKIFKDVWLIVIKYVLVPAHRTGVYPIFRNLGRECDQFCDDCMSIVYKLKNCEVCVTKGLRAPHTIQATKFVMQVFNNETSERIMEMPLFCQECYDPLLTCELHRAADLNSIICHRCVAKSKKDQIILSFNSVVWTKIATAPTLRIDQ